MARGRPGSPSPACALACIPSGLRWLRVAQREHYLPGSAVRFAVRWWRSTAVNLVLSGLAVAAAVASLWWPVAGVGVAAAVAAGPLGLSLRGRTSALNWTRRLRTLAAVWAVLELIVVVWGDHRLGGPPRGAGRAGRPVGRDAACLLTRRWSTPVRHFVDDAAARLARVHPTVVAITARTVRRRPRGTSPSWCGRPDGGGHTGQLQQPGRAGPAVNEHLAEGTEVFVARWAPTAPARSPTSAAGARPTWR